MFVTLASLLILAGCGDQWAQPIREGGSAEDAGADAEPDRGGDAARDRDAVADADACVPECGGRVCGDDGCGGSCLPGCTEHETCAETTGECVPRRDWLEVPRPAPGHVWAVTFDSGRSRMVAYGNGETWEYDGTRWQKIATATSPTANVAFGLAYDSARAVVVLHGGRDEVDPPLDETWEYDGATWRQILTADSPPQSLGSMVYDSRREVVVGWAGTDGTWEYDGANWDHVATATSPPATTPLGIRYDMPMAFDSSRGVTVLFAAEGSPTWEYDGTNWRQAVTADAPPPRLFAGMTYDASRRVIVLFGGWPGEGEPDLNDTWEYDGGNWRRVATPASPSCRREHGLAFDSARGVIVLFGGWADSGEYSGVALTDTWEYDGSTWNRVDRASSPPAAPCAMAYDSLRGVPVLYCGSAGTWEFDGSAWAELPTTGRPPGDSYFEMAFDSGRGVLVLLNYGRPPGFDYRTWEFDGRTWTEVAGAAAPFAGGAATGAMTYDAARRRVVLWGGGYYSLDIHGGWFASTDTWEYDGTAWVTTTTSTCPPGRTGHDMVFDSSRNVVLIFGGHQEYPSGDGGFADLWQYDGTEWSQLAPAASPPPSWYVAMAYDSSRGVAVVLWTGGYTGEATTWEYDGGTWVENFTSATPPGTGPMIDDAARGVVLLFVDGETWEYR